MNGLLTMIPTFMADTSGAVSVMQSYVTPVVRTLSVLASLACVFFLITGAFSYITSSGKPDNLEHAKKVIRNALLGLVIVLAATVITTILTSAYSSSGATPGTNLPQLVPVEPTPVSNGLIDILIRAVTGLLNNIIQSVATPFLSALSFFTKATPLMADNPSVFNLWLAVVGIADALFVLVIVLIGFHFMSTTTFGFEEIEFKHILPRVALIFLLLNTSIFLIDGIIELSNALIRAINAVGETNSVWTVLTDVVKESGGQGVAALLIMLAFLILSLILLVYYVGRLVTLFIGAVLAPLIFLVWLIPGFRDFSETAMKTYLTTIFVLFIHVIILQLAASLFTGMTIAAPGQAPNMLMAMVTGLATIIALLKTQGVMMQFSYASVGPRTARKLGGQFMTGVSYLGGRSRSVISTTSTKISDRKESMSKTTESRSKAQQPASYRQPTSGKTSKQKTGTTVIAPPRSKDSLKPPKTMEKP